MSRSDLDRVRRDLSTMRNALGVELPWSEADVWFAAAIAAAGGLYAVLTWPKSPWLVTSAWAAAPLAAAGGAYIIYIAFKSRSLPPREESRRREYKSTLIALAVVIPATVAYTKWGKYAGMTSMQLGGCALALMGVAFFVVGVATPPVRYPRSYLIVCAIPLIVFGVLMPLSPPSYSHTLVGLMGLVAMSLAASITHWHVRRQRRESGEDVSN